MTGTHRYTVALDVEDIARMATEENLKLDVEHDEVIELNLNPGQLEEVLERGEFERGRLVKWDGDNKLPR